MASTSNVDPSSPLAPHPPPLPCEVYLTPYTSEVELPLIIALIEKELSEPYIIYTYRYFLQQWPSLCWIAWARPLAPCDDVDQDANATSLRKIPGSQATIGSYPVGVIISKLDRHLKGSRLLRGYIAMLSIAPTYRSLGIATSLVLTSIASMLTLGAQEVTLETESDNEASLKLYERLGFQREKRLWRFYLNGKDCFRLVLPLCAEVAEAIKGEVEEMGKVKRIVDQ